MKNYLRLLVASVTFFMLQSCSMNTEVYFNKDATSTTVAEIDLKEFIEYTKSEGGGMDNPVPEEVEKLPTTWTSFYDMEVKDGKVPKNADSIRLMKKMFIKSSKDDKNSLTGVSFKMDRFSKDDLALFEKAGAKDKAPIDTKMYQNWDGKKLVINTESLNFDKIHEAFAEGDDKSSENTNEQLAQSKMMLQMMNFKMTNTLKFENKIKSITGKHDWIEQIDPNTIRIVFDIEKMDATDKLKNKDKTITIITE